MSKKTFTGTDVLAFATRAKNAAEEAGKKLDKSRLSILARTRATAHLTDRLQGYGLKPLKDNELKSVYALFAWVANEQNAAEETVKSMTEVHFNVNEVTDIQQKDYDEVIKFLVDLRLDEMKH